MLNITNNEGNANQSAYCYTTLPFRLDITKNRRKQNEQAENNSESSALLVGM
jgi:hypothetical protein